MNTFTEKKIIYMQNYAYNLREIVDAYEGSSWTSHEEPLQFWPEPHPILVCEQC